jgi:hypothetical protein
VPAFFYRYKTTLDFVPCNLKMFFKKLKDLNLFLKVSAKGG